VERQLYGAIVKGGDPDKLKPEFCKKFEFPEQLSIRAQARICSRRVRENGVAAEGDHRASSRPSKG
jgi:hypothetical protein